LGATTHVATTPAQLVRATEIAGLHYLISVPAIACTLVSLLPGGILPLIPVPTTKTSGPAGWTYKFLFVDFWSEVDPGTFEIRYTVDGYTTPVVGASPVGYQAVQVPGFARVPCDPGDIKVVCSGAGPVLAQVYLGIGGIA
jgi:hypothetical protein